MLIFGEFKELSELRISNWPLSGATINLIWTIKVSVVLLLFSFGRIRADAELLEPGLEPDSLGEFWHLLLLILCETLAPGHPEDGLLRGLKSPVKLEILKPKNEGSQVALINYDSNLFPRTFERVERDVMSGHDPVEGPKFQSIRGVRARDGGHDDRVALDDGYGGGDQVHWATDLPQEEGVLGELQLGLWELEFL